MWKRVASPRQASAQADDDGGANGAVRAQLRLLSQVPGRLFSRLYEQLGLRAIRGVHAQSVEEGMARLGTWMPFRAAQRELAFFLGVEVAEATVRQITEQAGAAQMQVQAAEGEALLRERPDSPVGPAVQLLSLDGALIQLVTGEWKEVKTLALGVGGLVKKKPEEEEQVRTTALSSFSRMSEAESFQQEALGRTVSTRGREGRDGVCGERWSGLDSEVGGLSPQRCSAHAGCGHMRWSM